MAKKGKDKDYATSKVTSSSEKVFTGIVLVILLLLAVVMVFPLIYMVATSFMTKNQILKWMIL